MHLLNSVAFPPKKRLKGRNTLYQVFDAASGEPSPFYYFERYEHLKQDAHDAQRELAHRLLKLDEK